MRRAIVFLSVLLIVVALIIATAPQAHAGDPDPSYELRFDGASSVGTGALVEARVLLDNAGRPLSGWQINVAHDALGLQFAGVEPGEALLTAQAGQAPDVYYEMICDDGWRGVVIVDFQVTVTMPPGNDLELYVATYEVVGAPGEVTGVDYCDCISSACNDSNPPQSTLLVDDLGDTVVPVQGGHVFEIVDCPQDPARGDVNGDGLVDLSDALYLLAYLNGSGPIPEPLGAGDANNDNGVDISDPIFLLDFLFTGGPAPAPPDCDF